MLGCRACSYLLIVRASPPALAWFQQGIYQSQRTLFLCLQIGSYGSTHSQHLDLCADRAYPYPHIGPVVVFGKTVA